MYWRWSACDRHQCRWLWTQQLAARCLLTIHLSYNAQSVVECADRQFAGIHVVDERLHYIHRGKEYFEWHDRVQLFQRHDHTDVHLVGEQSILWSTALVHLHRADFSPNGPCAIESVQRRCAQCVQWTRRSANTVAFEQLLHQLASLDDWRFIVELFVLLFVPYHPMIAHSVI